MCSVVGIHTKRHTYTDWHTFFSRCGATQLGPGISSIDTSRHNRPNSLSKLGSPLRCDQHFEHSAAPLTKVTLRNHTTGAAHGRNSIIFPNFWSILEIFIDKFLIFDATFSRESILVSQQLQC